LTLILKDEIMTLSVRSFVLVGVITVLCLSVAAPAQPQDSLKPEPKAAPPAKPETAEKPADRKPEARPESGKRETFTPENNPTTRAGRGTPELDNPQAPAAWVFVDGKGGSYKEESGHKLLQWFVEEPVAASPRFRVEAYEPLMGTPKDFKAVLRTIEPAEGLDLVYGISAKDGTFEVGKEYSLLNPGEHFVIRNVTTGDEVKEIAPLPSGKFAILASVRNAATGKETLAVTYFTVKSDE
jgi:hypothetical protein